MPKSWNVLFEKVLQSQLNLGRLAQISPQTMGYMMGGIVPAVLLGIYSVLQKASTKQGISPGMLLVIMGANIIIVGLVYCLVFKEYSISLHSGLLASMTGVVWGIATVLIAIALAKYNMAISKLVPLFNMNTLVAVCLGLWIFGEWKNINVIKLVAAAISSAGLWQPMLNRISSRSRAQEASI